jgi:hypothetical protein
VRRPSRLEGASRLQSPSRLVDVAGSCRVLAVAPSRLPGPGWARPGFRHRARCPRDPVIGTAGSLAPARAVSKGECGVPGAVERTRAIAAGPM